MKKFLDRYLFDAVKMLVTQLVIAIFGLVLALTCSSSERLFMRILAGIFSVLFYLFLLYYDSWNIGYKDKGHGDRSQWNGLLTSLLANSINLLLAVFVLLGALLPDVGAFSALGAFGKFVALLGEGMYTGLLSLEIGGVALNTVWYWYFIIIVPALLAVTLGYLAGRHEFMMTGLMKTQYPASDRPGSDTTRKKRGE